MIDTQEIWAWLCENNDEPLLSIASYPDYGAEIYAFKECGRLLICASVDAEDVYEQEVSSEDDCENAVSEARFFALGSYDDTGYEETIECREEDINDAVSELLRVVFESDAYDATDEKTIKEVKEFLLMFLYKKLGFSVYRPMLLQNDDGDELFVEYPYPYICGENKTTVS